MIKRKTIKSIYQEELYCDSCDEKMKTTNIVITTYPEQFEYYCPKCNNKITSFNSYPRLMYEWEEVD